MTEELDLVVEVDQAKAKEPTDHLGADGLGEGCDLVVGGAVHLLEDWLAAAGRADPDAVGEEGVVVGVEPQAVAEALDRGDGAGAGVVDALEAEDPLGALAIPGIDGANEDGEELAGELGVPGELPAQPERQGEDPLADRHARDDGVDEVGGLVGHAPAFAGWTQASDLAGQCHQRVVAAVGAADPGEATGQEPAAQIALETAGDEPRQLVATDEPPSVREERLPMPADNLPEHGGRRPARTVAARDGQGRGPVEARQAAPTSDRTAAPNRDAESARPAVR